MIGHQKQRKFLQKIAEGRNFSHAYLFSGQAQLGKKTAAIEWISSVFGAAIFSGGKAIHPDFFYIEPEEKEIKITQIRDLIWKLSLKPYSAPFKAAVIDTAHSMNEEAQNSLLKTLEEPRGKTILILISEYPQYLLPTILSRTERLKFYPVAKGEIKNYLQEQGISKIEADEIAEFSFGRSGQAINFLLDREKIKAREKNKNEIIAICKSDLVDKFQYAKELSEKSDLKEILDIWLAVFRENLMLKINLNSQKSVFNYPLAKIKNILFKIQATSYLIETTNVNTRLTLEALMLDL